ncbi:MAG: DUF202 domain-containing protein [Lysobacterales bacterium]|jgi:putative membrane protein
MIHNFELHAANERTYLAWLRTALSIAAFGFIVDKFNLWATNALGSMPAQAGFIVDHAGLFMMVISIVVLAGSTVRFLTASRRIDSEQEFPWQFDRSDLLLGISMVAVALVAVILMVHVAAD